MASSCFGLRGLGELWLVELWRTCQVDAAWVDELVTLQIRWHDGALKASTAFRSDPQLIDRVSCVLLQAWQFQNFSESWRVSLGSCCRTVLPSMLLGLEQYVNYLLDVAKCSRYYLGGFCRMDADVTHVIAMVPTCSCVSDQTLLSILEDD